MGFKERNKLIIQTVNNRIQEIGLEGKLKFDPIENTFKRRPSYYHQGDTCVFTAFLWQLNKLTGKDLDDAIEDRIHAARSHFKL